MGFDGTLKFDTSIDKSGFEAGLSKLGGIAKAGMAAVTDAIASAAGAMASLGRQAFDAYADYEQLTGGVATLFGAQDMSLEEYAQSVGKTTAAVKKEYDKLISAQNDVMQNAASAFKTAGLSQNEYMETVTSFSAALIASLDGDTAKAAQVADKAIIDMADNANKMGSSMESIQTAYQGFAKQNYTMLDNLKLGYGGTKSEMERLLADAQKISGIQYNLDSYADVVEAIHVIQTQMGIAGTTSREAAETISGSVAMTKSAFSNLLIGIADDSQDFDKLMDDLVSSAATAAGNILPRVETIIGGTAKLVTSMSSVAADFAVSLVGYLPDLVGAGVSMVNAIADGLKKNLWKLEEVVTDTVPMLLDGILSAAPDLISIAQQLMRHFLGAIASSADKLTDTAISLGMALVDGLDIYVYDLAETADLMLEGFAKNLTARLPEITALARDLMTGFAETLSTFLPYIVEAGVSIITSLAQAVSDCIPQLSETAAEIIAMLADELLNPTVLTGLLDAGLQIILTLARALLDNLPKLVEIASAIITNLVDFLTAAAPLILDAALKLFAGIVDALPKVISAISKELPRIVGAVTKLIPQIVSAIAKAVPQIISAVVGAIPALITALMEALPAIMDGIMQLADALIAALPEIIAMLCDALPALITGLTDALSTMVPQFVECGVMLLTALVSALPEIISQIVAVLPDLIAGITNGLLTMIPEIVQCFITLFMSLVQAIPEIVKGVCAALPAIIKGITTGLLAAVPQLVQCGITLFLALVQNLPAIITEIVKVLPDLIDGIVTALTGMIPELVKCGVELFGALVKNLPEIIEDAKQWGKDLIQNFIDGCKEVWNQWEGFWEGVGETIYDYLHHSTPEKGPLKDDDTWGSDFMENFITGAAGKKNELVRTMDGISGSISAAMQISAPAVESDAVRLLQNPVQDVPYVQPSATSTVVNNSYTYNSNTAAQDESPRPVYNISAKFEIDGERFAEYATEKVDMLQGEAVTLEERGTAH